MAESKSTGSSLPESPLVGSSYVGPAVSGTAFGKVGVSGSSMAPPTPSAPGATVATPVGDIGNLISDGVLGEGKNGVHGVSAYDNGVLGENSATGCGVSGTSARGSGVHGVNGAGSGATPKYGCGVCGESDNGYGIYGASKSASAIYGTSGSGNLAGEFVGNVGVTGNATITGDMSSKNAKVSGDANVTGNATISGSITGKEIKVSGDASITGNATITGDISSNHVKASGQVTANDVILAGADCAEEFDIAGTGHIEPGTVVVFDGEGAISQSAEPYNKRVAGVISGAGKYRPGVILGRDPASTESRAPVALMGRVYCKVDASYSPVEVGDMLTTSPTRGYAMKASDPLRASGAVIGKALASVSDGRGLIPILVTLQ
jgi:cytoskeletal protein CcmA (bactofilin family)